MATFRLATYTEKELENAFVTVAWEALLSQWVKTTEII